MNGVSLRRINTTHDISNIDIEMDRYSIAIDRSQNGLNRTSDDAGLRAPELSFNDESDLGGSTSKASENIQFGAIIPNYYVATPGTTTSATGQIRTVSGTSVDGTEVSFLDNGFENVELNKINLLSSTRIVASEVNENARLTNLPRKKSFTCGNIDY